MKKKDHKDRALHVIAGDYFAYMGRHFPQQCADDEFYFFPRSETAIQHLNTLDDLNPESIQDHIRYVQGLLREISSKKADGIEQDIDRFVLMQSMRNFIREFEDIKVWQKDPTLYVRVPLFSTGRILSKRGSEPGENSADLLTLFSQVPGFLARAIRNLSHPSEISVKVAVDMARDARLFYKQDVAAFLSRGLAKDGPIYKKNGEIVEAWQRYGKELLALSPKGSFAVGGDRLKEILATGLSYPRSPDEILRVAQYARHETQKKLKTLARKIDRGKGWQDLIYEGLSPINSPAQFIALYKREVESLRDFFYRQDIISFPPGERVAVVQTPPYLQSLRATASYSAPLPGLRVGHGIFYLTPGKEDLRLLSAHSPYLSAHETYPGHHVLDHLRIHHLNPVRRQIESPLFYEGWACYAEQLLDELGYVQDPRKQLVGLKRQLWRSLRAELDVKLHTERISLEGAAKEVNALGFSPQRAKRQVRRFALTPGYQLCYFIGNHEILRLREKFSSQLGLRGFHDRLLDGGEIPFHLVEKRLRERRNEEC